MLLVHIRAGANRATSSHLRYRPQARAVLAVGRYLLGLPFYRIEAYQAMLVTNGVSLLQTIQWVYNFTN